MRRIPGYPVCPALVLLVVAGLLSLPLGCSNYAEEEDHPFLGYWTGEWVRASRTGSFAIQVKNNGSFGGGGEITYTEQSTTITENVTVSANINDYGEIYGTVVFDTSENDDSISGTIEGTLTRPTWSGSGTMTLDTPGTPTEMTWSLVYGMESEGY